MLWLADATWTDVRDLLAGEKTPLVLVPVGAIEAHGPHLPLSTDVLIAEGLAKRAAGRLEDGGFVCVIAPPIVFSVTGYASGFSGTVGIDETTATVHVTQVCRGLFRAGFARVCLLNAHLEPAHVQTLRLAAAAATNNKLTVFLVDKTERRFARTLTDEYKRAECHAGSYETSLVLAERPDLVREERRRALTPVPINLAKAMQDGKKTFAEAGANQAYFGDPASATAEEGEWIYERLVEMVLTVVDENLRG